MLQTIIAPVVTLDNNTFWIVVAATVCALLLVKWAEKR